MGIGGAQNAGGWILVVDDDAGLRELIARRLEREGHAARTAADGRGAVEAASADRPLLMLLDYRLPDMTGQEVVLALEVPGPRIPFVVMTGQGDERLAVELMKLGASDYLIKDTELIDRLPAVVERVLREVEVNIRLRQAEEALRLQLMEKEILLKEVHHRVKNNIAMVSSLLGLSADAARSEEARTAILEARGRVESMEKLYERLLQTEGYGILSAKEYLGELVAAIVELAPMKERHEVVLEVEDLKLEPKRLFPLGLAVNELLTNALKYAFADGKPGRVEVSLALRGAKIVLSVRDDGKGLPPGFDPAMGKGFGLMLTGMLAQQLDGSFSMRSGDPVLSSAVGRGPGTVCELEFEAGDGDR